MKDEQFRHWKPGPIPIIHYEQNYNRYLVARWKDGFVVLHQGVIRIFNLSCELIDQFDSTYIPIHGDSLIAVNCDKIVIQDDKNTLHVYRVPEMKRLQILKCENKKRCLAISPNGTRLFCTSFEDESVLYDLDTGELIWKINCKYDGPSPDFIAISQDNRFAFTRKCDTNNWIKGSQCIPNNEFKVLDIRNGNLITNLKLLPEQNLAIGFGIAFDEKGRMIIVSGRGYISIWDCNTWSQVDLIKIESDCLSSICIFNDILFTSDGRVHLINLSNLSVITQIKLPTPVVMFCICLKPISWLLWGIVPYAH